MIFARIILINKTVFHKTLGFSGFRYAGLTCFVIARYRAFAISGGETPFRSSAISDGYVDHAEAG
jgi:hypothetical protein